MGFMTFPGGIHPDDNKRYSKDAKIELYPQPDKVVIPLNQHIGAPAKTIVKVGETVKTGQVIAEAGGFVSIPMHSSITGKVSKIGRFPHPSGSMQMAVEITKTDADNWVDLVDDDYQTLTPDEMKERIRSAGVCGMGGAGFPTAVKLSPPKGKDIDTIIINGVECEPYLTADHRLMLEKSEDILNGLKIFMKIAGAKQAYIGIEANKPDAIDKMKNLVKSETNIGVVALKLKYPQGAEKQLIYACTKRRVPNKGGLPLEIGVIVQNVGTALAAYEAVRYKKPLIDRVVTISGKIVQHPKNLQVRIGTQFSDLLECCGDTTAEISKIISGGPMMGFAISTLMAPVTKTSSGLILLGKKESRTYEEQTCIRCCRCVDVCPMNLLPSKIAIDVKYEDWDGADEAGASDCIKCGCCAYVCPAQIRLIQWIDIGKNKLTEMKK